MVVGDVVVGVAGAEEAALVVVVWMIVVTTVVVVEVPQPAIASRPKRAMCRTTWRRK